jgi:CheY-like chemotaxis protein
MRIVVCDDDVLMRELIESVVAKTGHEVVGVASTTAAAVGLIEAARADVVVLDIALSYGTDFDLIDAAHDSGARCIVFARHADAEMVRHHANTPEIVLKPDIATLERLLANLGQDPTRPEESAERRQREARAAQGPVPTGMTDAQAFFEAVNNALPGDAIVAFDVPVGAEAVAADVGIRLRDTDRVLLNLPRAVRCFLPGGGEDGVRSVLARLASVSSITPACTAASVVVADGEEGGVAFERLKHDGEPHEIA